MKLYTDWGVLAEKWAALAIKWRWPLLILAFIIGILAFHFQKLVPMESSVENMVLENDPDRLALNRFKDIFGSDQILIAAFVDIDLTDPAVLADLEAYRSQLCAGADFHDCLGITNLTTISGEDGEVKVEPIMETPPQTRAEARALLERARSRSDYINLFFNQEGTGAAIIARLNPPENEHAQKEYQDQVYNLAHKLADNPPFDKYQIHLAGNPILKKDMADYQADDLHRYMFILYAMLVLFLFLTHRRLPGVVLPLAIVVLSLYSLMTIIYFTGKPLSIVGSILPPLMLVYGISIASHIYIRYTEYLPKCDNIKNKALIAAFASVVGACFYNALTTACGFGSNVVSDIAPIKDFGIDAGIGVVLALVMAFLFALPLLSLFPAPKPLAPPGSDKKRDPVGIILKWISAIVCRHHRAILAIQVVILAVSLYGMSQIKVETKLIEYFSHDTPIYKAYKSIEQYLTGITTVEIIMDGPADSIKEPVNLQALEKLTAYMAGHRAVRNSTSLADYVKLMNQAMMDGDPQEKRVPDSKQAIAQLLLLYESSEFADDLWRYVDMDYSTARITSRIDSISSSQLVAMVAEIKDIARKTEAGLKDIKISVTGSGVIYANMVSSLVNGQIESFGLSLLLITILMILIAGHVGVGLVSLIPNLIPICVVMGIMGYFHISLDATTAMVAPVALGMAVDSTIHYMVRFRHQCLENGHDYPAATDSTINTVGRAMMATSIPLSAGFFVLLSASFMTTYYFGLLSGTIALLAMFYDLFVTPSALLFFKPNFNRHRKNQTATAQQD